MEGRVKARQFDLYTTLTCGQAFRWGAYDERGKFRYGMLENGYIYGIAYGCAFALKQEEDEIVFKSSCNEVFVPALSQTLSTKDFLEYYFSLDVDVSEVKKFVEFDERLLKAYERFKGIRIMRQEANEIAITFMFSANNSVRNIAKAVNMLSMKIGNSVEFMGRKFFQFPDVKDISNLSVDEMKDLPVRFENRLYATLNMAEILSRWNIYSLHSKKTNYDYAHEKLISIKGVGRKIADCILLFSLEHWNAFPVDVHIRNMMFKLFGSNLGINPNKKSFTDKDYRMIRKFAQTKFGRWAGWVQQYIYSMSRTPELSHIKI